jgi:hypothetical protein
MPLATAIATQLTTPVLDPEAIEVRYRVQGYAFGASFAVGNLLVDIDNPKNVGYADYMNGVPEAFFTINQDDAQAVTLNTSLNKMHIRILRNDRVVWSGWLMDSDESDRDVVFYAYGYMAGLYWSLSGWNQSFTRKEISPIVRTLWEAARTIASSGLNFVATGSIESVANASPGASRLVLPLYTIFYKRLLFAFQEFAALGQSDTTNTVLFEITAASPQFNFWANRGMDLPDVRWEWGGKVNGFRRLRVGVERRNDLFAVGAAPYNAVLRKNVSSSSDITAYFRRQEPLWLAWIRDETELERVAKLRLARATKEDTILSLRMKPNTVVPPGGLSSQVRIGDAPRVMIDRGATQIDTYMRLTGYQVTYALGTEMFYPQLADKS